MKYNSNYQAYLDKKIGFSSALKDGHVKHVQDGVRQEIALSDSDYVTGLERQSWDSGVLGLQAGIITDIFYSQPLNLNNAESLVSLLEEKISAANLRFVSIRISAKEQVLQQILETHGWYLVDSLNIYFSSLSTSVESNQEAVQEEYTLTDFDLNEGLDFLGNEAGLFHFARMHADANISNVKADSFYKEVFCSQYSNHKSFRVGLRVRDQLVGLAIGNVHQWLIDNCDFHLGYLWLIGLSKAYQGRKLSKTLLAEFLNLAKVHVDHLEIGTQEDNFAANKLYNSAGFKLVANAKTLHRWKQ